MALSGQLSDLSLAELIEFFCNQRKTGRLRVSYPRAPGFFYFQKGTMVDAKIGALSGVEAVYYALTLENASFNFSAAFEPNRRTIHQPWAQVALEGLRRMDEGIKPGEAFPDGYDVAYLDDTEGSYQVAVPVEDQVDEILPLTRAARSQSKDDHAPLSLSVENAAKRGRSPLVYGAIAAAVLISLAAVGFPAGWYGKRNSTNAAQQSTSATNVQPSTPNPADQANSQAVNTPSVEPSAEPSLEPASDPAALAARREREARERRAAEAKNDGTVKAGPLPPTTGSATDPSKKVDTGKPKTTTVQVTYDEAGRVTQASGGDANALRIARQKRFPAGKAGSATVTIPVN